MAEGVVNDNIEATIPITLLAPGGEELAISAIIDTGYTGFLAVPRDYAIAHTLSPLAPRDVKLGDGSIKALEYFVGDVRWNGKVQRIRILATKEEFLLGISLLKDLHLAATFRIGEQVILSRPRERPSRTST